LPIPLLLLALCLVVGAFGLFQHQARQHAELSRLEAQQQVEEAKASASKSSTESLEAPADPSDATARATALPSAVESNRLEIQVLDPSNVPVPAAKLLLYVADR